MNPRSKTIKELNAHGYYFKRTGSNHDIYFNAATRQVIPLKRHDFDESDMRYIIKEIKQNERKS